MIGVEGEPEDVGERSLCDDDERETSGAVAGELGLTPNNAMVRLHRAREALRIRLVEHCGSRAYAPASTALAMSAGAAHTKRQPAHVTGESTEGRVLG